MLLPSCTPNLTLCPLCLNRFYLLLRALARGLCPHQQMAESVKCQTSYSLMSSGRYRKMIDWLLCSIPNMYQLSNNVNRKCLTPSHTEPSLDVILVAKILIVEKRMRYCM